MKTLITRIKRLALALCFVTPLVSWAVEPVAVWDGDFSSAELTKYSSAGITLIDWQQTHGENSSSVTIDRTNQGLMIQSTKAMPGITVLARYSNLAKGTNKRVIATSCVNSNNSLFRTGIQLTADGKLQGMWRDNNGNSSANGTASGSIAASGVLAFVYSAAGTHLYYGATTDAISDTASWGSTSLKSSSDTSIYGAAIGGFVAGSTINGYEAAQGMTIEALAVFNKVLTNAEMTSYIWPSEIETITISGNTSVSAINTQVAAVTDAREVIVSLADGATVDVDKAFAAASIPYTIASEGSITLSAESQPDASYFTNADFSGVKGGLLRSWLTPGVVGFNFRNNSGDDTSGALATGTWYNDGGSVANGTSTALFADGLSTLTWASGGTWVSGSGSILSGYLDDGSKYGNGAEVLLSNVPYEEYDVIIYCNSDSNPGSFFGKTVNGVGYTWDSENGAAVAGSVSTSWGKAALGIPVYGVNAIRIKNLTGPLTIYGTPRYYGGDSGSTRGGIAAIQIMPPDTSDNIRTYTLTLDGTDTTWSAGTWTLEGNTVDAPTAGNVKIVASASTTVTVDSAVSLATLTVENSTDAVVSLVPGENGSISTINATVKSGVLKQGAANLVASTLTVEDGGTFDFGGFASQANVRIAGDGDGNYPWALTSTGDAPLGNWISLVLDADATIGGTGTITFGKNQTAGYINYNGHTLTKSGTGELVLTNGRTVTDGTGTLDIVGGKVTLSQYTCIDGYETIYANTAVIVHNGAELSNGTNRGVWIDTLTVESGATVTTGDGTYFGVTTALVTEGALTTTKLQFNDDATVTLGGDLTLTDFVAKGDNENTTVGDVALVLADGTESATVTVSGTVDAVGTVSVGSGITPVFSGESDVTATLSYAADPSPTESTALAFTQQSNWKGTVVLDYAITGASNGSVFQPGKYGNANSTVCLGQGATNIFLSVRNKSSFGDIDTKLYFKGDVSLRNGWGTEAKATTIPQLGADEGVTFTTRQGANTSNGTTYYTITSLKDFAGTIALSDLTAVTIGNVEMDALPEKGALVVKATTGTGNNKGTISGSVTVGSDTVALVFDTVNDVSGLYRPNTVDITIPTVDNATVAVTVGGVAVTPENGVVTVEVGSAVVVTYTAAEGYKLEGTGTFNFSATDGYSIDVSSTKSSAIVARTDDDQTFTRVSDALTHAYMTPAVEVVTVIDSTWSDDGTYDEYFAWDATARTYTKRPYVARIAAVSFTSLAAAIAYEGAEDPIVVLLADVTLDSTVVVTNSLTLDLNGYDIAATDARALWIKAGTVSITGKGEISANATENSSFADTSSVIRVGDGAVNANAASLTIGADVTVSSGHCYGVTAFGKNTPGISLVVNGTVAVTGTASAISGNGSSGLASAYITVNDGAVVSATADAGIYFPGTGTLAITGGTITGPTAVYAKCGTINITGGTLTGTAAKAAYAYNGNGLNATGDALVIDTCGYPGNPATVSVTGGTFTSQNAEAVASYKKGDDAKYADDTVNEAVTGFVTGGTFSSDVSDYCATGYEATEDSGGWTVTALPNYTVTFDADGGTPAPAAQTVQKGSTATAPEAPTKADYTFAGWTLGGSAYDFSTPVTGNITLVAYWTSSGINPTDPTSKQEVTVDTSLTAEEQKAAAIEAATVKVPDGVSGVNAATYKTYFTYSATPTATAGTYAVAITGFADEVTATADGNALAALEAATAGTALDTITVKPGLYYGTAAGADVTKLKASAGELNTTGKLDLSGVTKPSTGEAFFIKIKVSTTAFTAEE